MIIFRFLVPAIIACFAIGLWMLIKPKLQAACKKKELESIRDLKEVADTADSVTGKEGGSLTDEVTFAAAKVSNATDAVEKAQDALKD